MITTPACEQPDLLTPTMMPSMHCDTWTPEPPEDEEKKRRPAVMSNLFLDPVLRTPAMHCDTWDPEEDKRISMHCDTWVPEDEEADK